MTKYVVSGDGAAGSQVTRGLVGLYDTNTLPTVKPSHCAILALLCMLPILYKVWLRPNPKIFLPASLYVMMCSFMCLYHVHEKAILMVTIPLSLIGLDSTTHAKLAFRFNVVANCSLLPLLPNMQETPIKLVLLLIHSVVLYVVLHTELKIYQDANNIVQSGLGTTKLQWFYISGFAVIQMVYSVIQPVFFPKYEFLPLMMFSVYSAFGFMYCWYKCYRLVLETINIVFN